jgi:hypothetical protein
VAAAIKNAAVFKVRLTIVSSLARCKILEGFQPPVTLVVRRDPRACRDLAPTCAIDAGNAFPIIMKTSTFRLDSLSNFFFNAIWS